MEEHLKRIMPRFRYGVIHPRSGSELQRGPGYQLYRLVPLDVMELSTGLGLENYTPEGVEKALRNYWPCVDTLTREKADRIVFGGAPISAVLTLRLEIGALIFSFGARFPTARRTGCEPSPVRGTIAY